MMDDKGFFYLVIDADDFSGVGGKILPMSLSKDGLYKSIRELPAQEKNNWCIRLGTHISELLGPKDCWENFWKPPLCDLFQEIAKSER